MCEVRSLCWIMSNTVIIPLIAPKFLLLITAAPIYPKSSHTVPVRRGGPYNPDRGVPLGEKFDVTAWNSTCAST